ncbi:hypothetical protein TNCV_4998861 [Trichonephila clavipes]|nr:hypothetical protein TNCV_4998861 [Trichonephila clavipes]
MSRSGGQSEVRPPVFKSPKKLGTHLWTHCMVSIADYRAASPLVRLVEGERETKKLRWKRANSYYHQLKAKANVRRNNLVLHRNEFCGP